MYYRHIVKTKENSAGIALGVAAYALWGSLPLFWKRLAAVDSIEILCNRIVWACVFTLLALVVLRKASFLREIVGSPKRLGAAALSGALITVNWGIYIWAVNSGNIVEASMGYYLNPLVCAAFGMLFFRERADRFQIAAFSVAAVGVVVMIASYGRPPWIALSLGVTFALYGLVKKKAGLDALAGLFTETALVAPLAIAWLVKVNSGGAGALGNADAGTLGLLMLAGPVTAIPLFLYSAAALRVPLTTIGFLQYISPSISLVLSLTVFGEKLDAYRIVSFAFVLAALVIFSIGRIAASRTHED